MLKIIVLRIPIFLSDLICIFIYSSYCTNVLGFDITYVVASGRLNQVQFTYLALNLFQCQYLINYVDTHVWEVPNRPNT